MNDILDELQRKAEAATPGPWHVGDDDRPGMSWNRHVMSSPHAAVCFMAHSDGKDPERDEATAAHIAAADPQTVLRLIAVAKNAQEVMAVYSEELDLSDDEETTSEALQSNARRCEAAWLGLQSSLSALESAGTREEGTR